jgi:hypothetical protein
VQIFELSPILRSCRLALALTLAAIADRQVCSLAVIGRGIDHLSVGIGTVSRGEVGMIFANTGLALSVTAGESSTPPHTPRWS